MYLLLILEVIFSKQNAVILILCRNEDLNGIRETILNFEFRINKVFKYPYVFLNDKEFTKEFQDNINKVTNNNSKFGLIDSSHWNMPPAINREKALQAWHNMAQTGVPYVEKESYHNMCRFYSRAFYKHPLLADFKYFWRIEPNVRFHCDISKDPFDYMEENKKKYGFVIIMHEFMNSITSLLPTTARFLIENRNRLKNVNTLNFMFDNGKYNGCHFWSNFEIASFEFFRSKIYNDYVDYLENSGGFYYERWGDAPIHSIAASLFLEKSEIHFFEEIGYTHDFFTHCPKKGNNCDCNISKSFDFSTYSCLKQYLEEKNIRLEL